MTVEQRRAGLTATAAVAVLVMVVAAVFVVASAGVSGPAEADPCDKFTCTPTQTATATQTGSPGGEGDDGCFFNGEEIKCETDAGEWFAPRACYIMAVPRHLWPAPGDPIYGGADPETAEGGVYWCTRPGWTGAPEMFWLDGPPPVDPRVMVWRVVAAMNLQPITPGTAPKSGPDRMGLIGLPTWMWVDPPQPNTFGPITGSDSEGGLSVTATADVTKVEWNMGDGSVVTCEGPGTPYQESYGDSDSPDCGHRYQQTSADQPGNAYTVTATSYWEVTWSATNGASGVIRLTREATTQLRIGEMQVLVQ
jgi:hypothetical protein